MSFTGATGDMAQPAAEAKRSGLGLRVASALVLAPVVAGLTVLGGWPFALLVAAAGVLMGLEWDRLTGGPGTGAVAWLQAAAPAAAALAAMLWAFEGAAIVVLLAALALAAIGRSRGFWPPLGALWLALPCGALVWLRNAPDAGLAAVLWVLLLVWSADTLAYVFGRLIGGPKLAPRISPKKTWAGLAGAIVGASLVGAVGSALTGLAPMSAATAASGLAGAIGQAGDLAESAVKRRFGVKDSGTLIPGHGGILDRVDALLFATLAAAGLALANGGALLPWR
jgi:phosphatidate cytidylyltransferase